jgi:hypothetical protein
LGEYEIKVVSQPARQTLEESQFEQAVMLREKLGVPIPDEFLIQNSNLLDKTKLIEALRKQAQSEEAQVQQKMEIMAQQLELANMKAEAARLEADTLKKQADSAKTAAETKQLLEGEPGEREKAEQEMELEREKAGMKMGLDQQKHEQKLEHDREKHQQELILREKEARIQRATAILQGRASAKATEAKGQQPKGENAA